MKPYLLLGGLLIVAGLIAFTYQGITYTTREKVLDIGAMHFTAEKENTLPLTPVLGVLALAGGALVLFLGRRRA